MTCRKMKKSNTGNDIANTSEEFDNVYGLLNCPVQCKMYFK